MAEVVVSPIVDFILPKLTSLIGTDSCLPNDLKKDLKKLSKTFSIIRLILDDAEKKQIKDKSIRGWLRMLKDAAYEAEDIIDDCALEFHCPESEIAAYEAEDIIDEEFHCPESEVGENLVSNSITTFSICDNIRERIKEFKENFDEIAAERHIFLLSPGVEDFVQDRETSSFLTVPQIYGRVEDRESIVRILQDNARSQNCLSICPILGIGGLGKTTLAQLIYNDEWVYTYFHKKIWICVSDDISLKRVTKMMIDSLCPEACYLADLDPMQDYLRKLLKNNKFLLVLDDVWDHDREKWNKIIHLLTCGDKGSSVIVTTRLRTVVESIRFQTFVDSTTCIINPTHELSFLPKHDCWLLFKQYAFGMGNDEITPNLIKLGEEIISKCGGVPLAVKALGSLLHSRNDEFWRCVRDSELWTLQERGENTIFPALRLSYSHLPPILRQCFAYCSIYPKDYTMEKQKLIHQWMANGFIQSSGGIEVEDIGGEVFNELLRCSFFQDMCENVTLQKVTFKMHDLMHDLACSVMANDCLSLKIGEIRDVPQKARHVSMTYDSAPSQATLKTIFKSQSFCRTILFQHCATNSLLEPFVSRLSQLEYLRVLDLSNLWTFSSLPPIFSRLKHLRYLNLSNMDIAPLPKSVCNLRNLQILVLSHNLKLTTLPPSIGNLKQLRCLDLYKSGIMVLPESICCLTNLQSLNLEKCRNLKMLPKNLSKMRKLRKLVIGSAMYIDINRNDPMLTHMPLGIGELTCLKQLSTFVVSQLSDSAGIQELEKLDHLEGELTINGIQNVFDPRDAYKANLKSKESLSDLNLRWPVGVSNVEIECHNSKEVLEAIQPHSNVERLFIYGYPGVMLPSWVGSSTALPKLIQLGLYDMPNVEGWASECLLFPSCLQRLHLYKCPKLKLPTPLPSSITRLSVGKGNDPSLKSVEKLPNLSSLRITEFDEVETLPEAPLRNLMRLQVLAISVCDKLKKLPTELENLSTVTKLFIWNCGGLESLTEGLRNLTSLDGLRVDKCRSLKSLSESSLQHLTALQMLRIWDCPELEIMSVDFQHLISLRDLELRLLPQLTSLPEEIQHARRLQTLEIRDCENLRKLPEWLLELPALTLLRVIKCHPELHRICEDWNRIPLLRVENHVEL